MCTKRAILVLTSFLAFLLFSGCLRTQVRTHDGTVMQRTTADQHNLLVFYSLGCKECVEVKNKILPRIEKELQGQIRVEYKDTAVLENYKLLLALKEKYQDKIELVLPVFYLEGQLLNGRADIKNNLRRLIYQSLGKDYTAKEELPAIDLAARFKNLKTLGIIIAGLGDGINPCAFTVIVFFISFLSLQGYRKRELIAIGLSFILAVFLTYILIGLGLFNIIYSMEKFLFVRKIFNISIGIFSITLGVLSVYDLVQLKKTRHSEGLILQLPEVIKNQIHKIIGWHYRKSKGSGKKGHSYNVARLILSAFVTGFLISFLELVCTGQLYLPTIKFAMETATLKFQALTYLLLYNVMFTMPLLVIFLLAIMGVTSEKFSKFLRRHLEEIKILMAVLFFALGVFLLWRP
ncbi:MAG: cytochrome c biogenesis protein CcdA [Candidatus Omnitrophota bacterium]